MENPCAQRHLSVQAKVSAPTRAGRALRRSLLSGCVVVIVVAGYSGKRFVYERAHELGIRSACLYPFYAEAVSTMAAQCNISG